MVSSGQNFSVRFSYRATQAVVSPHFAFTIIDGSGMAIAYCDTEFASKESIYVESNQEGVVECILHRFPLVSGLYSVSVLIYGNGEYYDHIVSAFQIQVTDGDFYGTGKTSKAASAPVLLEHHWKIRN